MPKRAYVRQKPAPEATRPSLAKPPRPGSREAAEQLAATRKDQACIEAETLRRRLIEANP
jgi:hypothetical protein